MNLAAGITLASAAASGGLALVGWIRAKRTTADWSFVIGTALLAAERLCTAFSLDAATVGTMEFWQRWKLLALSVQPGAWLLFSLTFARGNASAFLSRWRWVWLAALAVPAAVAIGYSESLVTTLQTHTGYSWQLHLGWAGIALYLFVLTSAVFIVMNLERTFRAAVGMMRWRIKFVLLGVGVLFVVRIYTASQALLFRGFDASMEVVGATGTLIAMLVILRGILRSRQANTDVYPSLSVLQGSLTVSLAGLYLLVVGLFAKLSTFWGGDSGFTVKAFVVLLSLVGLAVLLQSDRVQLLLRHFLIRHFQRPLYDYRAIWHQFTQGTNSCVEQTELCRAVVRITADIFQALAVSLWLLNEQRSSFTLTASTAVSPTRTNQHAPSAAEVHEIVRYFEHHRDAVDIETRETAWAITLRNWHPSDFPHGGNRVCVPLLRQNHLIGLMIMGDRVKGVSFPLQDFDLLKCIADQVAAKLLNLQLAHRLVQTKEVEAFQTMATFLVHDLKNAASTLNLMLQNMPVHFNDPAFREDALRGMGKTVNHINGLIARLGQFRNRMELQRARQDLNEIVQATLADFPTSPEITVSCNLAPLPALMLDREQVQKVLLNLLLNATEACQGRGAVNIATVQQNGTAVLSVADNGCGMSRDFLEGALFRPFKTTKKNGLGIGMFQSKMIVEAHGGNVGVTSAAGKGTTFEIFLPLGGPDVGSAKAGEKPANP